MKPNGIRYDADMDRIKFVCYERETVSILMQTYWYDPISYDEAVSTAK